MRGSGLLPLLATFCSIHLPGNFSLHLQDLAACIGVLSIGVVLLFNVLDTILNVISR